MRKTKIRVPTLSDLEAFVVTAETGSLSRAAFSLAIAQPVLSRRIAALEQCLDGRVFWRTGRGVRLTELGDALIPKARALVAQAEQLVNDARAIKDTPSGTVNLGLSPSLALPIAAELFEKISSAFPGIRLRLFEGFGGDIEDWLTSGRIDIAISNHYGAAKGKAERTLMTTNMLLVGPDSCPKKWRSAPVRFAEVATLPLVLVVTPNAFRAALNHICNRRSLSLDIRVEADSATVIKKIVSKEKLFTILPWHAVSTEIEDGSLFGTPISDPQVTQRVAVKISAQRPTTNAILAVHRLLCELVSALAKASETWLDRRRN